ncbi:MAG TPA: hypothetical protein DCL54_17850 [Alphaproteobacteria bacterium]|nr:hypothetical protein [Alphaproteobacteria bacterium]HAJ48443.1 hypothetical protein [Alphaproteobacteria bacterium]
MAEVPAAEAEPNDAYYVALEAAMQQTARGRWFLAEHGRRSRASEGAVLLDAMQRLTDSLNESKANASLDILRRELQEMSASIVHTRREIASIKPSESGHNKIIAATEELDHIVRSTETATADILSASERLQVIAAELQGAGASKALCAEIEELTTNIMLSCSFQDLTGQRTSKVVNALRYIEQRVNSMIEIWGISAKDAQHAAADTSDKRKDAHLLNGPAREGEGVSQDDIDLLLSGEMSEEAVEAPTPVKQPILATKGAAKPAALDEDAPSTSDGGASSQADIDALFD